jgi:hypothetical protein
MLESYEDYLTKVEDNAVASGTADFRLAREEFHNATGKFEDGEPWFEIRMKMFMEWYLLDRTGTSGLTPLEEFLVSRGSGLDSRERAQLEHLTATHRSAFRIAKIKGAALVLEDLILGSVWEVESTTPTAGLEKDDIIDTRVIYFGGKLIVCQGTVLHPKEARNSVLTIIARAKAEGMPQRELVNHLDKMRLKLDRYSNVRINHIYRYPTDAPF